MERHWFTCCICGRKVFEFGCAPWPIVEKDDADCCQYCDWQVVIPARFKMAAERESKEASNK